jgi:hypothetical protein
MPTDMIPVIAAVPLWTATESESRFAAAIRLHPEDSHPARLPVEEAP